MPQEVGLFSLIIIWMKCGTLVIHIQLVEELSHVLGMEPGQLSYQSAQVSREYLSASNWPPLLQTNPTRLEALRQQQSQRVSTSLLPSNTILFFFLLTCMNFGCLFRC